MNKLLSLVLVGSIFGSIAAAADISVTVKEGTVTVSTGIDADERADILVVKKGEDKNDNENVFAMQQEYAADDGNISFIFNMPSERGGASSTGEYDIFIKPQNSNMITGVFAFVTDEEKDNFFAELNAADADYSAIFENPDSSVFLRALGCLADEYALLSAENKAEFAGIIKGAKSGEFNGENFGRIFNTAILIENSDGETNAARILRLYSPVFEEISFNDMETDRQEWVAARMTAEYNSGTISEFEKNYNIVNALYIINNEKFDKLAKTMEKYENILGIASDSDYKKYDSLSAAKKNLANEKLASAFSKNPIKTVDALLKLIREVVDSVSGSDQGSGGSGGSRGSGGSGGGNTPSATKGFEGIIAPGDIEVSDRADNKGGTGIKDIEEVTWAKEAILSLAERGVISGDESGYFKPNDNVTREAFIKMIVSAEGMHDPNSKVEFDDVPEGSWYYSYIASAFLNKIAYGVSETSFGTGSNITRQDMAVMAYRAAKGYKTLYANREPVQFSDGGLISEYAKEAVTALYQAAVISGTGDGNFNPTAYATRAEAAVVIHKLFTK